MNKLILNCSVSNRNYLLGFTLIDTKIGRYKIESHLFNLYLTNKSKYDNIMKSKNLLDINKIFKYL